MPILNVPVKSRYEDSDEYVRLYLTNGVVVTEHRYIMTQILKRELDENEIVHHVDGNKKHNIPQNLMVLKRADHPHSHLKGTEYIELICAFCNNKFTRDVRNVSTKIKKGQKDFYCNRSCMARDFGGCRSKQRRNT